jgi:hypothetical protein
MKKWLPWAIGGGLLAWFFFSGGKKTYRVDYTPNLGQNRSLNVKVGDAVMIVWPILPGKDEIDLGIYSGTDLGDVDTTQHGGTQRGPGLFAFNVARKGTGTIQIVSGDPDTKAVHGQMLLTITAS